MTPPPRRALRVVAAVALTAAAPAGAGVTGGVELQSHTSQNLSPGVDRSPSTLLMERLSLHYAGLPFGPDVAVATLGAGFSNVTGWMGKGPRIDARVLSFDGSVGLLPRRALPLRLYASGAVQDGSGGLLASHGAGPTLLYGAALNVEPGAIPGVRLDASEARSSRPGHPDLSDVRRALVGSTYGNVAGQRVNLGVRAEDDRRAGFGEVETLGAVLSVSSAPQQTTLVGSQVRRTVPSLSGITTDRNVTATSNRRWSPALTTQAGARLSEAGAGAATGRVGDVRGGFTWVVAPGARQLTFSAAGSAGRSRTESEGAAASGSSWGGSGRIAYDRPLGRFTLGLGVGAAADTCDCSFGNDGTTRTTEATASFGLPAFTRGSGQAAYTVLRALAPATRGGDRLEHHARATGRLGAGPSATFSGSVALDDGTRELLDISSGRATTLRERAVTASLGVATGVRGVSLSGDVRHTRGRVVTDASPFVAGGVRQARSVTSGQAGLAWRPLRDLSLRGAAVGTWTTLDDRQAIGSYGVDGALDWRLDRFTLSLQYQALRVELYRAESTFQHSIRTVLARPFEL